MEINKFDKTQNKYKKYIKQRILELMRSRNLSEVQLSSDLGNGTNYIHNVLNGVSFPLMGEFLKICEYFDITPAEFFDQDLKSPDLMEAIRLLKSLPDSSIKDITNVIRLVANADKKDK